MGITDPVEQMKICHPVQVAIDAIQKNRIKTWGDIKGVEAVG